MIARSRGVFRASERPRAEARGRRGVLPKDQGRGGGSPAASWRVLVLLRLANYGYYRALGYRLLALLEATNTRRAEAEKAPAADESAGRSAGG